MHKYSKKFIFIVLFIIVVILGICFLIFSKKTNQNNFDIDYTTSFFLQNSDGKYALFNEDGKNITDFIFTSVGVFYNGTAKVEKGELSGIINAKGKMTVNFGNYKYILPRYGLYEASGENLNENYLINGNGDKLYDLKNISLFTYHNGYYHVVNNKVKNNYDLINYDGKKMLSIAINSNVDEPVLGSSNDGSYVSMFYNGKTYVFNVNTTKEIVTFNSEIPYCITNVTDDGKKLILSTCNSNSNPNSKKNKLLYKVVENGKVIDIDDDCYNLHLVNNRLVCSTDNGRYLLDKNYKKILEVDSVSYIDEFNYAKNNEIDNSVDVYKNGKIVKNIPCKNLNQTGYTENGIYILKNLSGQGCSDNITGSEVYNSDGKKVGGNYELAISYSDIIRVSDNGYEFYLINNNGNQLSKIYDKIGSPDVISKNYFFVSNDFKQGIIDLNGKEVIPCIYDEIMSEKIQNKEYLILKTSDSKYIVYDLDNNKKILESDIKPSLLKNYILIGKNEYYSYKNGKKFY